jgi:riboflavin kinase/FMN adenylyltransferase
MEVLHDVGACPRPDAGSVVTIGAYDGVHLGHQTVIAEVRKRAAAAGLDSAVVTFDRHPASVVRPESAPACSPTWSRSSSCWRPPGSTGAS